MLTQRIVPASAAALAAKPLEAAAKGVPEWGGMGGGGSNQQPAHHDRKRRHVRPLCPAAVLVQVALQAAGAVPRHH